MKWFILILMIGATYSDARPKVEVRAPKIAEPLEELVPKLDSLTGKLTELLNNMQ